MEVLTLSSIQLPCIHTARGPPVEALCLKQLKTIPRFSVCLPLTMFSTRFPSFATGWGQHFVDSARTAIKGTLLLWVAYLHFASGMR